MILMAKYDHINFTPPKSVQAAAQRGLALRRKYGRGGLSNKEAAEQGIGSGVQRATNLANGDAVSPETIGRMVSFFARHEKNKNSRTESGEPGAGMVAWLLWGGTPGQTWSNKVKRQMEAADMENKSLASLASQILTVRGLTENNAQNGDFLAGTGAISSQADTLMVEKIGARHTSAECQLIQDMHDLTLQLGAECHPLTRRAGAKHSIADQAMIQRVHDDCAALGAECKALPERDPLHYGQVMKEGEVIKGGPTSGNWGHAGRPGKKGGSGRGGGFGRIGVRPGANRQEIKRGSRQTRGRREREKQPAKPESEAVKGKQKERIKSLIGKDVGVIRESGGQLRIQTPYNPDFVTDLKSSIPGPKRQWDSSKKEWTVNPSERDKVQTIMDRHYDVVDFDKVGRKGVQRAEKRVKQGKIRANQLLIKENEDRFLKEIDGYQDTIDSYSFSSRNRRKMDAIRVRDLLGYALADSKKPIGKITEPIQIRGMAAALRELRIEG